MTIQLIHPKLGVCAEAIASTNFEKQEIITRWKYRYGKKFNECEVKASKQEFSLKKKVIYLPTQEVYESAMDASKHHDYHERTIAAHCRGELISRDGKQKFKYAS